MIDCKGIEIAIGQTVKERAHHGKIKVVSLDEPFVYVRRENAFDDAPSFPEDLTVIQTHEVLVSVLVKCNTEDEALEKIKTWVSENEKTLPIETVSYSVANE